MAGPITILGLDYGIIRFGSMHWRESNALFRASIRQSFSVIIVVGLLFIVASFRIIPLFRASFLNPALIPILQIVSIGLLFFNLQRAISATTIVSQQMIHSVRLDEIIQPTCQVGLIILFAWMMTGPTGAFVALTLSFAVTVIWGHRYLTDLYPELFHPQKSDPWLLKQILSFSIPAGLSSLASFYIFWIDRLLLGYYSTPEEVGIYQAASQSSLLFATILASINAIFVPIVADLLVSNEKERLQELFRVSTKWGLYVSMPLALIFLLAPDAFLSLAFGEAYSFGYASLQILTIAQLINLATGAVNLILLMGGYQFTWMLLSGMMLVVNVVTSIFLIPQFGIVGAAWGTAVSIAGLSIMGLLFTKKKLGIWPYDHRYMKGGVAFILAFSGGLIVQLWQFSSNTAELGVVALVTFVLYVATLWFFGIDAEDKAFIATIKARLSY